MTVRKLAKEIKMLSRVMGEFTRGMRTFRGIHGCVTVYGSARFKEHHPYYLMAQSLGRQLALEGFSVMTGGGPGIMEAANRGAKGVASGLSIGCAIELPFEEKANDYLDKSIKLRYFFCRKIMLTRYSVGFVAMPGGFGTMDELFEVAVLVKTKRIKSRPIVLMGKTFWQPLMDYLETIFVPNGTIGTDDTDLFFLTDSSSDAVAYIKQKNLAHV